MMERLREITTGVAGGERSWGRAQLREIAAGAAGEIANGAAEGRSAGGMGTGNL